jgi:DsbC/DsbD-like thiol-disulfide interchange protein
MIRRQLYGSLFAGLTFLGASLAWDAEAGSGKLEKSDSKVKATATATKAGADGKQTVTITLEVVKGWHLYANPVNHNNEFLDGNQTTVKIAAKEKIKLTVKYPAGKTITDKKEKYDVYDGVVKIQADVVRTMGDSSPLEITIAVSACDNKVCLQPGTLKLRVP